MKSQASKVLNGLLVVILFLQVGIWGSVTFFNVIPIPDLVFEKLRARLAQYAIQLQSDQPVIDLTGRISFKQAKVFFKGVSQVALQCDRLQIRINPAQLLLGNIEIDAVTVSNGTFFCPALQSPSGVIESTLKRLFCNIRRKGKSWEIDHCNFQIYNLNIASSGRLNVPFPNQKETEQLNIQAIFYEIAGSLVILSVPLKAFKDPALTVTLGQDRDTEILATLYADGLKTDQGIKTGPLYARAFGDWEYGWQPFKTVWAKTPCLELPYGFTFKELETQFSLTASGSPIEARFFAEETLSHGQQIDYLYGQITLNELPDLSGRLAGSLEGEVLKLEGRVNTEEKAGEIAVSGTVNPLSVKDHLMKYNRFTRIDTVQLPPKADINAQISLAPGFTPKEAVFALALGPFEADGIQSTRMTAQGFIDPKVLDLTFQSVHTHKITGTFHQDLLTEDYRLLVEGSMDPSHLNAWIEKDWWPSLWEDFDFKESPPYANLDVRGRPGNKAKHFLYGNLKGTDFNYHSHPVERVRLKLESRPKDLKLFDIWLKSPDGEGTANFSIHHEEKIENFDLLDFEIDSTVDPKLITSSLSNKWQDFASDFVFTEPPKLRVDGKLYGNHTGKSDTLSVNGEAQTRLYYKKVPLDSVKVEIIQNGTLIDVKNVTLGLADGTARGAAQIRYKDEQPTQLALQAQLTKANLAKIARILHIFTLSEKERAEKKISPSLENGIFELKINVQGPYGNLEDFQGEGDLYLASENLAKINLLGPLSRLLDKVALPSGTIEFNKASAPFIIGQGYIYFPDFTFTGPSSRINAQGDYSLLNKDLSFEAKLFFLPIWGQVFKPLSHAFEFEITGTVAEPEWQFSLDPLKLLSNEKQSQRFDPEKIAPVDKAKDLE